MTDATRIHLAPAKRLTPQQELGLIRQAHRRAPQLPLFRTQLAQLLNMDDAFDETIALLGTAEDLGFGEEMLLTQALLAVETPQADRRALEASRRACDRATSDAQRAAAIADGAKALRRMGDPDARAVLIEALRLDPHNKDACKRLAALHFDEDDPGAVLALTDRLAGEGACHSRLFAARTLACARLGQTDEVRASIDQRRLGMRTTLATPEGWESLSAFNAALAHDLLADPAMRYNRYGSASEQTWRIDGLGEKPGSPLATLLGAIRQEIAAHIDRLAGIDDAWAAACPDEADLHAWCVITEGSGFETWHVHQFGWLSGAYYVAVPDSIATGTDERGCIAFGLPEDLAGDAGAAAIGHELVRPTPGQLLLFPSHCYHRTFPHASRERRICVAFDLRPA